MTELVDLLAAYRIARLLIDDVIADRPRERLHVALEQHPKVRYALSCYWCSGLWIAAGVVAARKIAPRVWSPVARALAYSTVAGLLGDR